MNTAPETDRQFSLVITPCTDENVSNLQDALLEALQKFGFQGNAVIVPSRRTNLPFERALEALKRGWMARLPHWSEDVRIVLQRPDENSKMTYPYLYVESRYGCVPWKETNVELLCESWEVAPYEPLQLEECCCAHDPLDSDPQETSCDE